MLVTPHLVGYWPFEGNANDASGNGNNGTVHGASLTKGKFGQCYSFDGVDDYIDCGNDESLKRYNTDFTIGAWIKLQAYNSSYVEAILSNRPNGSLFCVRGLSDSSNAKKIMFDTNQGTDKRAMYGTTQLQLEQWYHVVISFIYQGGDNNIGKIYVNGQLENSTILENIENPGTDPTLIGWDSSTSQYYFNGFINQVQIYNKALSQSDIRRIMLGMHPLNG